MTTTQMPTSVPTTRTPYNTTALRQPVGRNKTVLVLSSLLWWNPPLLIDSSGRQEELDCFSHEAYTEGYKSCSLVWNNHLYIFGGHLQKRQISKLNQYRLRRIGSLPFDLQDGSCTNMADRKLFLCFHKHDPKRCYWSVRPLGNFQSVKLASYNHSLIKISSSKCESSDHFGLYE